MLHAVCISRRVRSVFFFNATSTTETYTLSLHDALPISTTGHAGVPARSCRCGAFPARGRPPRGPGARRARSEEHTSELQSRFDLVCRLLLEKKKTRKRKTLDSLHYAQYDRARVSAGDIV